LIRRLRDRSRLEEFLRRDPWLHLYELGDLDDFYWPHTTWYGLAEDEELRAVCLLYTGREPPTLIALGGRSAPVRALLEGVRDRLPPAFYAHLSPGVAASLRPSFELVSHGLHLKMALSDPPRDLLDAAVQTEPLGPEDEGELLELYTTAYPDHWFDPRMLETGQYLGIRDEGQLVSAGGVHVWSPRLGVAALGNIVTHPDWRGHGLGTAVTAALCRNLRERTPLIGLNVGADNLLAIHCYRRIGFRVVTEYEEHRITRR
jgi:ribosomal protein S18 acetylase RimI-like enzyme